MNKTGKIEFRKLDADFFKSKSYKYLKLGVLILYALFMMVYPFRSNMYSLNNQYITLFAETAPNLIPGYLFTIVSVFFIVPMLNLEEKFISRPNLIWVINLINIIIFILIECLHIVFNLGMWDNNDILATIIGISLATITYHKLKDYFLA